VSYARSVQRVLAVSAVALAVSTHLALIVAGRAEAAPKQTLEAIHHGLERQVEGAGCTATQVTAKIGGGRVIRTRPEEGDSVGMDADVLDVVVTNGRIVWTVGPDAETCERNNLLAGADGWSWSTRDYALWKVVYRQRLFAIRASPLGGVQSIAGFRVTPRTRRTTPTMRRVTRSFGRPASLRRLRGTSRVACKARWKRLGLTATFVNFGGNPPCRFGYLQTATIAGPRVRRWTASVAGLPGITAGTSLGFLERVLVGEGDVFGRRLWTLSQVWVPYGDAGYIPAVSAQFSGRGRLHAEDVVRGFELYVGAGGD
jgi:hypothetical protein